jgi:DNA-binding CsgD family transcriptional regulator
VADLLERDAELAALDAAVRSAERASPPRRAARPPARTRRARDDARELVDAAWANAAATHARFGLVPAALAAAELGWLTGEPGQGNRARGLLAQVHGPGRERDRGALLAALHRLGDPVEGFPGCPEEFAAALRGDVLSAAAAWGRIGDPYERARALTLAADPATVLDGLATLDALEARAMSAVVRRRLRERGHHRIPRGPSAVTRAHPAGPTARQSEILRLLAAGMSNAEIAERLVVSVRTVDHHVSAVVQKLGVTSRREAAALFLDASEGS